jgi:hypothetical protein
MKRVVFPLILLLAFGALVVWRVGQKRAQSGARLRLRPILMTTLTAILGLCRCRSARISVRNGILPADRTNALPRPGIRRFPGQRRRRCVLHKLPSAEVVVSRLTACGCLAQLCWTPV